MSSGGFTRRTCAVENEKNAYFYVSYNTTYRLKLGQAVFCSKVNQNFSKCYSSLLLAQENFIHVNGLSRLRRLTSTYTSSQPKYSQLKNTFFRVKSLTLYS